MRLGELGRDWERVGQTGSDWVRLGQTGSDCFRLGETGFRVPPSWSKSSVSCATVWCAAVSCAAVSCAAVSCATILVQGHRFVCHGGYYLGSNYSGGGVKMQCLGPKAHERHEAHEKVSCAAISYATICLLVYKSFSSGYVRSKFQNGSGVA